MTARLVVEACGPLTTVQDGGRFGWLRFGVPRSGPVDRLAFAAALAAVGAEAGAGVVEMSAGGLRLACEAEPVGFALCGAAFEAEVDGVRLGAWTTGLLTPGARLVVHSRGGAWAYLAFAGRLVARAWLGSLATHAESGLGGGRMQAGDVLTVEAPRPVETRALPPPAELRADAPVRIVLGPQERYFAPETVQRLLAEPFAATARLNRMGLRLDGPPLPPLHVAMASEPAVRGALQVDGEGQVTVLLADHQTTGGYPKIAVALPADADRVAQLAPGAPIRFQSVSPAQAAASARAAHAGEAAYLARARAAETLTTRLWTRNLITAAGVEEG